MKKISICIATWKRKDKLKKILYMLENQTMAQNDYEIIVADSNSNDGTCEVVKKLQQEFDNIVYIPNSKNILAAKRNDGIKTSQSDIIVFIDDDVFPTKNFIYSHYHANQNPHNTFFCGQIRFNPKKVKTSNYYKFRDEQHLKHSDTGFDLPFNRIVVMNLSFRKEYISVVGNMDERFLGYGCEDIEFGYRVIKNGFKLRYLESALAYHEEESSNIEEYGKKLYKSGLYGERLLKVINEGAYFSLQGKVKIGKMFHFLFGLDNLICQYLKKTDAEPKKYSYLLYKIYLYAMVNRGIKDQNKFPPLNQSDLTKGW